MDMDIKAFLDKEEHVHIKINVQIRVHSALEKNLGAPEVNGFLDFLAQILFRNDIPFFRRLIKSAKPAP